MHRSHTQDINTLGRPFSVCHALMYLVIYKVLFDAILCNGKVGICTHIV